MKTLLLATTAVLTVAFYVPAFAATDGTNAQTPQAIAGSPTPVAPVTVASAKGPQDPNQIICKTVEVTGSHLGSTRTCRTRAVWDEMTRASREEVDKVQSNRSFGSH